MFLWLGTGSGFGSKDFGVRGVGFAEVGGGLRLGVRRGAKRLSEGIYCISYIPFHCRRLTNKTSSAGGQRISDAALKRGTAALTLQTILCIHLTGDLLNSFKFSFRSHIQ